MWNEFKEFAIKGNVVDMAVGIMIGAAFATVVSSLVDHIVMPPIGLLTGGVDFANQFVLLAAGDPVGPYATHEEAMAAGATVIAYGLFINDLVTFVIVGAVLFFVVRWVNRLRRPETPPAPTTKPCPYCQLSIDLRATRCPNCTSELDA